MESTKKNNKHYTKRAELFVNSTLPHYDVIPAMVNYGNGGPLFVARDEKGEISGTIGIIVNDEDLKKKRGERVSLSVPKKKRGISLPTAAEGAPQYLGWIYLLF